MENPNVKVVVLAKANSDQKQTYSGDGQPLLGTAFFTLICLY